MVNRTDGDEQEEEDIAVELEVLEKHSAHKNIARFFGAYLNDNPIQLWFVSGVAIHFIVLIPDYMYVRACLVDWLCSSNTCVIALAYVSSVFYSCS